MVNRYTGPLQQRSSVHPEVVRNCVYVCMLGGGSWGRGPLKALEWPRRNILPACLSHFSLTLRSPSNVVITDLVTLTT